MEVAGITIGAVGLNGLFDVCVDCFGLFKRGQSFDKYYDRLVTRLGSSRLRFKAWGEACGLTDPNGYNSLLDEPVLYAEVLKEMKCIALLFIDREKLVQNCELNPSINSQEKITLASRGLDAEVFRESGYGFLYRMPPAQEEAARLLAVLQWRSNEKRKLAKMTLHLDLLVRNLIFATTHLNIDQQLQRYMEAEIMSLNEVSTLENLVRAGFGLDDIISTTASRKLSLLNECANEFDSNGGHPTSRPVSSTNEIYYSLSTPTDNDGASTLSVAVSKSSIIKEKGWTDPNASLFSQNRPKHAEDKNATDQGQEDDLPTTGCFGFSLWFRKLRQRFPRTRRQINSQEQVDHTSSEFEQPKVYQYGELLKPIRLSDEKRLERVLAQNESTGLCEKRLGKDIRSMIGCNADWISLTPVGDSLTEMIGRFEGPPSTPYEGGIFNILIKFPADYPFQPPLCTFITNVFHPNVSSRGEISLDLLSKKEWCLALSIEKLLLSIASIFSDAGLEDVLEPATTDIYMGDRMRFAETARDYTIQYASPKDAPLGPGVLCEC